MRSTSSNAVRLKGTPMGGSAVPDQQSVFFPASAPWREENGRLKLKGSRCSNCNAAAFPHHGVCPTCGDDSGQTPIELSDTGTLYTYSHIHIAPKGFRTPYTTGYVD